MIDSTDRILITGGAGTLGSNIVDHYAPSGAKILVIDNFATGNRGALPESFPGLVVQEGTVADAAFVQKVVTDFKPSHIIHSAAAYKDPENWTEDVSTNVFGAVNVIRAAEEAGVKKIINFQTALCYGVPDEVPIPDDAPLRPKTSYAVSKVAAEGYLLQSSVPYVTLRLGNVTSPRLSIGPIPTFYSRLKDGKACFCSDTKRDFLDISDFMSLLDKVMQPDSATGAFNVSTGEGHSMKEIFDIVVAWLGVTLEEEVPIVAPGDDDVPEVVLDASRTMKAFDWKPEISFRQTIENMLSWYDSYGITAIYSHLKAPGQK